MESQNNETETLRSENMKPKSTIDNESKLSYERNRSDMQISEINTEVTSKSVGNAIELEEPKKKKSHKKRKSGKKKEPKKPAKDDIRNLFSYEERKAYEIELKNTNAKLAKLRKSIFQSQMETSALKGQLQTINDDHMDVAAHLTRIVSERNNVAMELTDRLKLIERECLEMQETSNNTVKELLQEYHVTKDTLSAELNLASCTFKSLDELRLERDQLYAYFEKHEQLLKSLKREFQEKMYQLDQNRVVKQKVLNKEAQDRLNEVCDDFNRIAQISGAGYTKRLMRENYASQKEIDRLIAEHVELIQEMKEKDTKYESMEMELNAMTDLIQQLSAISQNKEHVIKKLTESYDSLKRKYTENLLYRKHYDQLVCKHQQNEGPIVPNNDESIAMLQQTLRNITEERDQLATDNEQATYEIYYLSNLINNVKLKIEDALLIRRASTVVPSQSFYCGIDRKASSSLVSHESDLGLSPAALGRAGVLSLLLKVMDEPHDEYPPLSDMSLVYKPGRLGLIKQASSVNQSTESNRERTQELEQLGESAELTNSGLTLPQTTSIGNSVISNTTEYDFDDGFEKSNEEEVTLKKNVYLCYNYHQYPLDLYAKNAKANCKQPLTFVYYDIPLRMPFEVVNTGDTVKVLLTNALPSKNKPFLRTSQYSAAYEPMEFHFHWNKEKCLHTKDTPNGIAYDLEMHVVHKNVKYESVEQAIQNTDGLVILAMLFKTAVCKYGTGMPALDAVFEQLKHIQRSDASATTEHKYSLLDLLGAVFWRQKPFLHYKESLTVAAPANAINWFVSTDIIKISEQVIKSFEKLVSSNNCRKSQNTKMAGISLSNFKKNYVY